DTDDRRADPRVVCEHAIKLHDARSRRYIAGRTCDLSSTGMRLEVPAWAPIELGAAVSVYVAEDRPRLAPHSAMKPARVVWIDRGNDEPARRTITLGLQLLQPAAGIAA
ncbi:MAG TPA: PilZ domain-containing protein, partial [Tepidisphaeraceae bacterium]|nr:PilZ domain-containing protein [Tepidisphaeraceae bacterium]